MSRHPEGFRTLVPGWEYASNVCWMRRLGDVPTPPRARGDIYSPHGSPRRNEADHQNRWAIAGPWRLHSCHRISRTAAAMVDPTYGSLSAEGRAFLFEEPSTGKQLRPLAFLCVWERSRETIEDP